MTPSKGRVKSGETGRRKGPNKRDEARHLRALLEATTESAVLLDLDGNIVATNETAARRIGVDAKASIGTNLFKLFPPDLAASRRAHLAEVVRTGQPVRFTDERGGAAYDSAMHPVRDEQGRLAHVAAFAKDVTESRRLEEQLRATLRQTEALLAELHETNRRLQEIAHTDDLTGLPNRRCFFDALEMELHRLRRYGGQAALAILDVDRLKAINDSYGHAAGDQALAALARVLREQARHSDTVARYGGDEFVLLMPNTSVQAAAAIFDRVRAQLGANAFVLDGKCIPLAVSVGICALSAQQDATADAMLHLADQALYAAKQAGRNCTRFAT